MKLLIMHFYLISCYFILLRSKYSFNTLFSNTLNLYSSLIVKDQVSHLYKKKTCKIIGLYILIFPRACVTYRNMLFLTMLVPRLPLKLHDHPLSIVRDCLFNTFAATFHTYRPSSSATNIHFRLHNLWFSLILYGSYMFRQTKWAIPQRRSIQVPMTKAIFWVVLCRSLPTFQRCLLPPSSEDSHLHTRRRENLKPLQVPMFT
jgi:hypothetical protein